MNIELLSMFSGIAWQRCRGACVIKAWYGSRQLLAVADQAVVASESGALVVACSGLVAASPVAPVGVVVGGFRLVPEGGE
jgi:hypothetical protein